MARLRGIRAGRASGAPGHRSSHNLPVVGSSPTRPTCIFNKRACCARWCCVHRAAVRPRPTGTSTARAQLRVRSQSVGSACSMRRSPRTRPPRGPTQFAAPVGTAGTSRSGEAMPGTRNGRFRRSSVPVMPRNRLHRAGDGLRPVRPSKHLANMAMGHPLNRQIRSVVSAGSAGAIYAYRRVGQRWRSGGSCESGLVASSAGSEVVTVRLSHRARPAGQLI